MFAAHIGGLKMGNKSKAHSNLECFRKKKKGSIKYVGDNNNSQSCMSSTLHHISYFYKFFLILYIATSISGCSSFRNIMVANKILPLENKLCRGKNSHVQPLLRASTAAYSSAKPRHALSISGFQYP